MSFRQPVQARQGSSEEQKGLKFCSHLQHLQDRRQLSTQDTVPPRHCRAELSTVYGTVTRQVPQQLQQRQMLVASLASRHGALPGLPKACLTGAGFTKAKAVRQDWRTCPVEHQHRALLSANYKLLRQRVLCLTLHTRRHSCYSGRLTQQR